MPGITDPQWNAIRREARRTANAVIREEMSESTRRIEALEGIAENHRLRLNHTHNLVSERLHPANYSLKLDERGYVRGTVVHHDESVAIAAQVMAREAKQAAQKAEARSADIKEELNAVRYENTSLRAQLRDLNEMVGHLADRLDVIEPRVVQHEKRIASREELRKITEESARKVLGEHVGEVRRRAVIGTRQFIAQVPQFTQTADFQIEPDGGVTIVFRDEMQRPVMSHRFPPK